MSPTRTPEHGRSAAAVALALAVLAPACADEVEPLTGGGADAALTDRGVATPDSGLLSPDGGPDASVADAGDAGDAGPVDAGPMGCGGFTGLRCPDNMYCDFGRNNCGADDALGRCRLRPQGCFDVYIPTCGCDGVVHGNECEAYAAGADLNAFGCPAPDGFYGCGWRFCDVTNWYCQASISDVAGEPDDFSCAPNPAACGGQPATCECLQNEPCGSQCVLQLGGPRTICPGG